MSKITRFVFRGGPRDGEVLENGVGFVPDVINRHEIHLFGADAYAVMEIDHEAGFAVYEHMRLVNTSHEIDGS